jgi:hypothetical protein
VERLFEYFGKRKYLAVRIGDLGTRGEVEVGREASAVAEQHLADACSALEHDTLDETALDEEL